MGRGARPRRRRAATRARRARQRSDLRRLVRLGERGPVPPRAEPAAPIPELHRRLHRVGQQLLARRVRGDPAARRRRRRRGAAARDDVEGDPRTHRARRRVRRHEREERVGQPGRRDAPHACAEPRGRRPARAGVRAVQPAAQRPHSGGRRDVAPDRSGHRHRGDARARVRARQRGAARHRVPRPLLRRRRPADRVHPRRGRRAAEEPRVGGRDLRHPRRRRSASSRAAWRRTARWSP